jgi:hypothetical protein
MSNTAEMALLSSAADGEAAKVQRLVHQARLHSLIDQAIEARIRLREVGVEMQVHLCAGLATAAVERAMSEAHLESDRAIRALNRELA